MNFWWIFLCLLIGTVIGYEFGKYTVTKRVRVYLDDAIKNLKITAENLQKKKEHEDVLKAERQENLKKLFAEVLPKMEPNAFQKAMGLSDEEFEKLTETNLQRKDILKQGANTNEQRN